MLRFVIRRKMLDRGSTLASESLKTVDAECPELERMLLGGGADINSYDYREIVGVEVLPAAEPECNRGNRCPWTDSDPSYCRRCGLKAQGSGQ